MFSALSSYASNAAATIARLNHAPCAWNSVRYLSAILNDMARSGELIDTLVRTNSQHLDGVPIDTAAINAGVHSSGVEVACLLADIALKQVDDVCAEFFQAEVCLQHLCYSCCSCITLMVVIIAYTEAAITAAACLSGRFGANTAVRKATLHLKTVCR
jgi:hypothetical protein